jgi:hypothetical protein
MLMPISVLSYDNWFLSISTCAWCTADSNDFLSEKAETVDESFWTRRATWDVNVYWNDCVDSFEDVVGLEIWPAGDSAFAHCDAVLWFRHLLPEANNLVGEFLTDWAIDKKYVGLSRR